MLASTRSPRPSLALLMCAALRGAPLVPRAPPMPAVLHAGAYTGFTTVLFKLLFPNATIVALEPDPGNFKALQRNTQS